MALVEQEVMINNDLARQNYLVVDQFISESKARELATLIREQVHAAKMPADNQVPGSPAFAQLPFLIEFHHSVLARSEEIVGAALIPTYVYGRVYQQGAILAPHRDRDACEISMTVNLCGTDPWGIWFENPTGEKCEVVLQPGFGAFYLGCDALHWREQFQGLEYIQIFVHFVLKHGKRSAQH